MKQMSKIFTYLLFVTVAASSCKKEQKTSQETISQETLTKISQLGFGTTDVQKIDEGYLVEGDIILTSANLDEAPGSVLLRIAKTEQYRTYNLVTGLPRVITVSSSGNISANASSAVDGAISRYNAQNLGISFQRVSSGGNINIKIVMAASYIASSGFPTGGNPYPQVKFNRQYQNWGVNTLASVFAHEIGHCIGFRHTDYMDRSYSCGGSAVNEGASTVGAVYIPGTPTGPDAASWMLACIGNGVNRPFNNNDVIALNYLY